MLYFWQFTWSTAFSDFRWSFSFCFVRNSLKGTSNLLPIHGILWICDTAASIKVSLNAKIMKSFWKKNVLLFASFDMALNGKILSTKENSQKQCNFLSIISYLTWICILIIAFPITVAPKKVQKGTRKCPHVIPAKSNNGLGICNINE